MLVAGPMSLVTKYYSVREKNKMTDTVSRRLPAVEQLKNMARRLRTHEITRRVTGQSFVCSMVYMGTLSSRNTT
jgi:hypothetical protein